MTDDNVTTLDNTKQAKDPKVSALNKFKEAALKESNTKIEAQVKRTLDAVKIANNEKKALAELLADHKEAAAEFADLLKEI